MKTLLLSGTRCSFFFLSIALMVTAPLKANDGPTVASVKLSLADKPALLRVNLPWADVHITGVEGIDTVTVKSALKQKGREPDRSGLRRLDDEVSFELTEHDNVVHLTVPGESSWSGGHDASFSLSVPRAIALDVRTEAGGDLEIKNVTGDVEINNQNGRVRLDGLAGSAVINTTNGDVSATYSEAPKKIVSITSMDGKIDLRVPADTKANVRLRTQSGSIFTDFDKTALKTKSDRKNTRDDSADVPSASGVIITLLQNGNYTFGTQPAPLSLNELANAITELGARDKQTVVTIRSEKNVKLAQVTAVMDACRQAGITKIVLQDGIAAGKLISGTLNGGGEDIKISTMTGEITLRQAHSRTTDGKPAETVTVTFQNPDSFTDAGDHFSTQTSTSILEELRDYLRENAPRVLAPGHKLFVTFLDLDLAGDIRMNLGRNFDNIRVMTSITPPRVRLRFELIDADGAVVKEGERQLSDFNYQQNMRLFNRTDALFYDKELLQDWLTKEFKTKP